MAKACNKNNNCNSNKLFYTQPFGGTSWDIDALAYISASGITDEAYKLKINTAITQLKAINLYSEFKALYFLMGGDANKCKFNAINPLDADAAFRITWIGGVTFDATGVQFNRTTGYGLTHIIPATHLSQNDFSMFCHSTYNTALDHYFMGVYDSTNDLELGSQYCGGNSPEAVLNSGNFNYQGFRMITRTASNEYKVYVGSVVQTFAINSVGLAAQQISLGGLYENIMFPTSPNLQICAVGNGFSESDKDLIKSIFDEFSS